MRNGKIFIVVLMIVSLLLLGGCDFLGLFGGSSVTIEERIDMFGEDLDDGNWTSLYKHFDPDSTEVYNNVKSSSTWTARYQDDYSYEFEDISVSGNSAAATLVVTTGSGTLLSSNTVSFTFTESDGDKVISTYTDGALIVQDVRPAY